MKMSDIRRISAVVGTIRLSNVYTGITDDNKYELETEIATAIRQSGYACFLCVKDGVQYTRGVYRMRKSKKSALRIRKI